MVVGTMREIAQLADAARLAIEQGDQEGLAGIINRNFDLRRSIFDIRAADLQMIETARKAGASSSFCGSGGYHCVRSKILMVNSSGGRFFKLDQRR